MGYIPSNIRRYPPRYARLSLSRRLLSLFSSVARVGGNSLLWFARDSKVRYPKVMSNVGFPSSAAQAWDANIPCRRFPSRKAVGWFFLAYRLIKRARPSKAVPPLKRFSPRALGVLLYQSNLHLPSARGRKSGARIADRTLDPNNHW